MEFDRWDKFNIGFGLATVVSWRDGWWLGLVLVAGGIFGAIANSRRECLNFCVRGGLSFTR